MLLAANALAEEGRDLKLIVNGAPVVGAGQPRDVGRRSC